MTQTVGLIGWPTEHSLSPALHGAAFRACGLDWQYTLLPTPAAQLEQVCRRIRRGELAGANVTIPHKTAIIPLLDALDPAAAAVGAVNTIVRRGDRLIGCNTDVAGFARALAETGVDVANRACAVLGAGGAARAVLHVLRGQGARVAIYARDAARAAALAGEEESVLTFDELARLNGPALVVNATPVGMWPRVEASPWPYGATFPPTALAFDLIYRPRRTRWMAQAEASGARATNGVAMLAYQGAAAFEMWTGCAAPVDAMRAALDEQGGD